MSPSATRHIRGDAANEKTGQRNTGETKKGIQRILDTSRIIESISRFRFGELARLTRLGDYYAGRHGILDGARDATKPDNRLVNNFCRSITDCTVGYFLGVPVTYVSDDSEALSRVTAISAHNDESFVNSALARDMSVYGRAAEILWLDEDRLPRFTVVDAASVIPVEGDALDGELEAAIRVYVPKWGTDTLAEVYTADAVETYKLSGTESGYKLEKLGEREHFFGAVPVNVYRNNRDMTGDFEPVLTLVDAYNKLQSASVNDFELFADSYLVISGMGGTTIEDVEKFRRERVLLVDEGGDARWLTKNTNDAYVENLKERIARDIYRFSSTVDLADRAFTGGDPSGTAIRYRMAAFDDRVSVTEKYFAKALCRRLELISSILGALGESFDASAVRPRFTRNVPGSVEQTADVAAKLDGIVSRRTLHELLPFVENADAESERMAVERVGAESEADE